jgi:hypothetical protein
MPIVSEHPETLEEVKEAIERWLGHAGHKNRSLPFRLSWERPSFVLCFISRKSSDLKLKTARQWVWFEMNKDSLKLNLDRFLVSTAIEGERVCLSIEVPQEPVHRFLEWGLREIAETKHPAFQSRILRAFINLEEDLPTSTIEEATAAPTDLMVALEAISSAPGTSQLIKGDALLAAKVRGLNRKRQMLDASGGALSSEQVADVLGISRQAVDKRRASSRLLALTQGRRGYSYPRFQFEEGKTVAGLEEVLARMKGLDGWMQLVFFTSPNERLEGKTPIASLHQGLASEVANVASSYGEQGAV